MTRDVSGSGTSGSLGSTAVTWLGRGGRHRVKKQDVAIENINVDDNPRLSGILRQAV